MRLPRIPHPRLLPPDLACIFAPLRRQPGARLHGKLDSRMNPLQLPHNRRTRGQALLRLQRRFSRHLRSREVHPSRPRKAFWRPCASTSGTAVRKAGPFLRPAPFTRRRLRSRWTEWFPLPPASSPSPRLRTFPPHQFDFDPAVQGMRHAISQRPHPPAAPAVQSLHPCPTAWSLPNRKYSAGSARTPRWS